MVMCFFGTKGGVGCSVVASAFALVAARHLPTLLVDLGGDVPAILGVESGGPGLAEWLEAESPLPDALSRLEFEAAPDLSILPTGRFSGSLETVAADRIRLLSRLLAEDQRTVVVDLGRATPATLPLIESAGLTVMTTRACYLALRAARGLPRPDEVVLVTEDGRALRTRDVCSALGVAEVVEVEWDATIARAVDSGLLAARVPRKLRPIERLL